MTGMPLTLALLRLLAAAAIALFAGQVAAVDPIPDADSVDIWRKTRESLFGTRIITPDNDGKVIQLRAPSRAQDASIVPIGISTKMPQTPERYIRKVYLLIDRNPSPIAAIFTLTPESGRADIETRVRVEEYTWMRAIAELDDGGLFMSARYVKAAGGCSAPYGTAPDFERFVPKLKLKLDASVVAGEPVLAQLMIQHPNSSGLARDQLTQLSIPAYYVRTIEITFAGMPVMSADIDFSISENPNFRFYFVPRKGGELKAVVVDTKEREIEGVVEVELAK
jgi:sulfur-oxidizing protein SoxY